VELAKDRNEVGTENVRLINNENPQREECNFLGFPSSIIYKAYEWDKRISEGSRIDRRLPRIKVRFSDSPEHTNSIKHPATVFIYRNVGDRVDGLKTQLT